MRAPHGASLAAPFMACPCRTITPGSGPLAACTYKKEGHCLNAEHAPPDDRHLPLHHTEPCSFPCGATAGGLCMHNAPLLFLLPRLLSQMFSTAALPIHMPSQCWRSAVLENFLHCGARDSISLECMCGQLKCTIGRWIKGHTCGLLFPCLP